MRNWGVVMTVGNTNSVDIGALSHPSKDLKSLTESTSFKLGLLVCVLPWKPQVITVPIFPRPQRLEPLGYPCQAYASVYVCGCVCWGGLLTSLPRLGASVTSRAVDGLSPSRSPWGMVPTSPACPFSGWEMLPNSLL